MTTAIAAVPAASANRRARSPGPHERQRRDHAKRQDRRDALFGAEKTASRGTDP